MTTPAVVRIRPPRVVPVELWDLELGRGILWDHMDDGLEGALHQGVRRLVAGQARTRSGTPIPAEVRRVAALWLAGGRATTIDTARLAAGLDRPVWCADAPAEVPRHGARALLPEIAAPVVVDLGQSHLKIFTPERSLVAPRPWDRLVLRGRDPQTESEARRELRAWMIETMREASVDPEVVVVALPCELGDDPVPGGCSYVGMRGDRALVPDIIAGAGWRPRTTLVLNDAELAAAAAGLDPRPRGVLTLVLTLGFGVGGALRLP